MAVLLITAGTVVTVWLTTSCVGGYYLARYMSTKVADCNRGWGRFCTKRCKAIVQEKRTGQYAG